MGGALKEAAEVTLVDPHKLERNKDNPRLIFREEDMLALQESIRDQGILVPLTVYAEGDIYRLLDGERRWRSAIKLGMPRVPVIIQAKPERLTNIMMMFAIHHARKDWDPLPTALKLAELEKVFERLHGKKPKERELAGLASMLIGEVRRLKKLLDLPLEYRKELLGELKKPDAKQVLTVDHVLEATNAVTALLKAHVLLPNEEEKVTRAIVDKFRDGVIKNTVSPRKLTKLARAVSGKQITIAMGRKVVLDVVNRNNYTIDDAYRDSVEQGDFERNLTTLTERVQRLITEHRERKFSPSPTTRKALEDLSELIRRFLSKK
jgi:ParB family transcriptional regulator, chromosome partitioning protein